MKKMMFLSKNWYFSVPKALIYYTFNKPHHNSFILLVFSRVANFRFLLYLFYLNYFLVTNLVQPDSCYQFYYQYLLQRF